MAKAQRRRSQKGRPEKARETTGAVSALASRQPLLLALGLFVITAAVFSGTLDCGFVNFDDPYYVTEAPAVRHGLTWISIRQAFTEFQVANWHPLTTLTLAMDATLGGLDPFGFHLRNLLLHALAAALLLLALTRLTGRLWPSAAAAALFALHPLRVESVAWISSRKDVLSGVFFMLVLLAWERYARGPSHRRMGLVAGALLLGLMAKPTLVVVPAVLLILDVWPLGRLAPSQPPLRRLAELVAEKWPLILLAAGFSVLALFSQASDEAMATLDTLPFSGRLANAPVAMATYLRQLACPTCLAVLYPLRRPALVAVVASIALLAVITAAAVATRRRAQWLAVGWTWYAVALLPVIGIVQVGTQAHADRYTYLPQIGLVISLAWAAAAVAERGTAARRIVVAGWAGVLISLTFLTARQVGVWRDGTTLWRRALACTSDNVTGHVLLGRALAEAGEREAGLEQTRAAMAIDATNPDAANDLATDHYFRGELDQALALWQIALDRRSKDPVILANMGRVRAARGEWAEAEELLATSLALRPDAPTTLADLGVALLEQGQVTEAVVRLRQALEKDPSAAQTWLNLGRALAMQADCSGAAAAWRQALAHEPGQPLVARLLAWQLATSPDPACRDGVEAVRIARILAPEAGPAGLEVLAAALAEAGQMAEAVTLQERALAQLPPERARAAAGARLASYRRGEPWREVRR